MVKGEVLSAGTAGWECPPVAVPAAAPSTGDATQQEQSARGAGEGAVCFPPVLPQLLDIDFFQPLRFLF